ncbi:hypothetical protein ZWY2020_023030 [Hordeum vulgare]|nr:hypothetical protein ZWY2020_023030 [Hordeum vulgare]
MSPLSAAAIHSFSSAEQGGRAALLVDFFSKSWRSGSRETLATNPSSSPPSPTAPHRTQPTPRRRPTARSPPRAADLPPRHRPVAGFRRPPSPRAPRQLPCTVSSRQSSPRRQLRQVYSASPPPPRRCSSRRRRSLRRVCSRGVPAVCPSIYSYRRCSKAAANYH